MNYKERKKLDALVKRALKIKSIPKKVTDIKFGFTLDEFVEKVLQPQARLIERTNKGDER